MKYTTYIFVLALFLMNSSCSDSERGSIPNTIVNFSINLSTDPLYSELRIEGNALKISAGDAGVVSLGYDNNGILIYNAGNNKFTAYDCSCPHDYPTSVSVNLTSNNIAECPTCKSRYVLASMALPSADSPSKEALKNYRVTYNPNTGILSVFN